MYEFVEKRSGRGNLFLLSTLKGQSPGFAKRSLDVFFVDGIDVLPDVGTSSHHIMQNLVG